MFSLIGFDTAAVSAVRIGNTDALVVARSSEATEVLVMPGTRGGRVEVITDEGSTFAASSFEVDPPPPMTPLTQRARVATSDQVGQAGFGSSVALSADGQTLAAGAYKDANWVGAAWVFRLEADGGWVPKTPKLADGTTRGASGCQGYSVALNATGSLVTVGGHCDTGASWTYARQPDGTWRIRGARIDGLAADAHWEAMSLATSAAGTTLLRSSASEGVAAARVLSPSASGWETPGTLLAADAGFFTAAVGLSADGNVALVSGTPRTPSTAYAWVFHRVDGVWQQPGQALFGTDLTDAVAGHTRAALSGDGSTAVLLALRSVPGTTRRAASAWVFRRAADGTWRPEGGQIDVPGMRLGSEPQGLAVDFVGGRFLVVGAGPNGDQVKVAQYLRGDGGWAGQGEALSLGAAGLDPNQIGPTVAISLDGATVVVGVASDNGNRGAVYVLRAD
ncbi:MAG: hypothetical protein JNG84_10745 [Archangium sp.]|nr:hypothetical protein [Archangium sp.]